jgi:hypothetical protein
MDRMVSPQDRLLDGVSGIAGLFSAPLEQSDSVLQVLRLAKCLGIAEPIEFSSK